MLLLLQNSSGTPTTVRYWPMLALTSVIAGSSAIGTVDKTLDDVTVIATAQVAVSAQVAKTLDDVTLQAVGLNGSGVGAVNVTLDDVTVSAQATVALQAQIARTLDDVTLSATAIAEQAGRSATLAKTLDDVTLAATASTTDFGRVLGGGRLSAPQSSATVRSDDT